MNITHKIISRLYRFFTNKKLKSKSCNQNINDYIISDGENDTYFGYHDRIPFSLDNSKILAVSYVKNSNSIKVGYFNYSIKKNKFKNFHKVTTSNCWSTQQGNMLTWDPNNPNDTILFNNHIDGAFCCEFYNIFTKKNVKTLNFPFYSISPCGELLSSLNFSKLGKERPGYGYLNYTKIENNEDYLFIYNLSSKKKIRTINAERLSNYIPNHSSFSTHLNHIVFSPDSRKIAFMQILVSKQSKTKTINLFIYDLINDDLILVEKNDLSSHFCWKNNYQLIITKRDSYLRWRYFQYDLRHLKFKKIQNKIHTDGHPMINPNNQKRFITDTSYIDNKDQLHLIDSNFNNYKILKSYNHPPNLKGKSRCDLHPRWNHKGDTICVDIYINKNRKIGIVKLND